MLTNYHCRIEGTIDGRYRKVGDEVPMTKRQAKYYLQHGTLSMDAPAPAKPVAASSAKKPNVPATETKATD